MFQLTSQNHISYSVRVELASDQSAASVLANPKFSLHFLVFLGLFFLAEARLVSVFRVISACELFESNSLQSAQSQ
jgi:hypothetical protein